MSRTKTILADAKIMVRTKEDVGHVKKMLEAWLKEDVAGQTVSIDDINIVGGWVQDCREVEL